MNQNRFNNNLIESKNIQSLKTLLQQGKSVPIFCGDLVYKNSKELLENHFSELLKKITKRFIKAGHAAVCMPGFKPNYGF